MGKSTLNSIWEGEITITVWQSED